MATMRKVRHEMLKAKWIEIIREHSKSGLAIRAWCELNQISAASFFYWSRVIRQDSLVKAGTMAVTGQAQFAEITSDVKGFSSNRNEICAVIRSHGNEIEIHNGADSTTLESILRLIGRS
nr:hypothetical protein [Proteiniclasticum sp.]